MSVGGFASAGIMTSLHASEICWPILQRLREQHCLRASGLSPPCLRKCCWLQGPGDNATNSDDPFVLFTGRMYNNAITPGVIRIQQGEHGGCAWQVVSWQCLCKVGQLCAIKNLLPDPGCPPNTGPWAAASTCTPAMVKDEARKSSTVPADAADTTLRLWASTPELMACISLLQAPR